MKLKNAFAIVLNQKNMLCFEQTNNGWQSLLVSGETCVECNHENDLKKAMDEINRIHGSKEKLKNLRLNIISHEVNHVDLKTITEKIHEFDCHAWQLLRTDFLLKFINKKPKQKDWNEADWIIENILPLLNVLQTETYTSSNEIQEYNTASRTLQEEIIDLQNEKRRLECELQAICQMDLEHLITYLPALYQNFWGYVRPDELAIMAGTIKVPAISSPYSEPSADTILTLRERLENLPLKEKQRLRDFCKSLRHKLIPRPEMKYFFKEKYHE